MTRSYMAGADAERLLQPFFSEEIDRTTLDNGLVAIVKPDTSAALVSVQAWVKTGSIHEGDFLGSGLSHYLEHMLFKGTRKRLGPEIAAEVQKHGGNMNAYTTFDRTVYYIDIPSEYFEVALDVLADAVFDATIPPDEAVGERDVILREIDMGLDDPDRTLTQTLFSTAFREHPYRYPVIGYRDVFESVTHEDLLGYYRSRYLPNNLALIVAGDVEADAARERIEHHFGGFNRRKLSPVLNPFEPEQVARRDADLYRDVNVSRCTLAFKIPGLFHRDAPGLDILAAVLGNGKSSVLWKRLRDGKQLVHEIDAMTWKPGGGGLLGISFTADPDKRERASEAVLETIESTLRDGLDDGAVNKAVRQALVSEINVRKTVSGQASRLGVAEVVAGDIGFSRAYFRRLADVSAGELGELGRHYLQPGKMTAVSLNPESARPAARKGKHGQAAPVAFEEETFANGARLLFHHNAKLPNVHVRLICLGGGSYESPEKRGVTALLAALMTRDTEKRSAEEVSEEIESVGGAFSEFCGNNTFGVSLEFLPDDFDIALDLLDQAVCHPVFQEDTFRREKAAQLSSLKEELDEILFYGMKRLRERFFGDHPLCIEESGTTETIPAIGLGDLVAQYRRLVVPANLVLSVAGDLADSKVVDELRAFLKSLPSAPFERGASEFGGPPEPGGFSESLRRQQAVVLQGFPDCGVADETFPAGEVLDELFSGMSSRLFERVREELGLAYYVGSGRVSGIHEGMFFLYAGTHPEKAGEVTREMDAEIRRVREGGVTPEELERCRVRIKARKRMSLQTNSTRAMIAGLNATYGLPVNHWLQQDAKIDAVTLENLQAFAKRHLQPEKRVALTIGPNG